MQVEEREQAREWDQQGLPAIVLFSQQGREVHGASNVLCGVTRGLKGVLLVL